ncbi:MAG: pentapeptide repeat-containing protein [Nitrospina sp.]|nr:pentapeptide repeat-containing protein [Nitrospina sp.]
MTENQNSNNTTPEDITSYFPQKEDKIKEDSKTLRNSYITYLSVAAFIWMIVESITHRQLLIPDERIKLPLFGLEIPVITFFSLTPVILLVFYSYFLIHAVRLAEVLAEYKVDLERNAWFPKVHGSLFTWYFLEPEDSNWMLRKLTSVFVFLSFWCLVPVILLRTQWQFLPYHSWPLTLLHQTCLTVSLILAVYFSQHTSKLKGVLPKKGWLKKVKYLFFLLFITFSILTMVDFSWSVLKIPANVEENKAKFELYQRPYGWIAERLNREAQWTINSEISEIIDRNLNLREASLALKPGDTIIAKFAGNKDENEHLLKYYGTLDLQGRDLRFAIFEKADLRKADLRNANLLDADLDGANLQGSNFSDADLLNAYLGEAHLQGSNFRDAKLLNAYLGEANLKNADLVGAYLQGADFTEANLQDAFLFEAYLEGAELVSANLQNALLDGSNLQGSDFRRANLQGAFMGDVDLQGADFRFAIFGKTDLSKDQIDKVTKNLILSERKIIIEIIQEKNGKGPGFSTEDDVSLCHNAPNLFRVDKTGDDKPCEPRKVIYREELLCKFPVLIDQQNSALDPLFSKGELREIVEKKCPQHLARVTG